MSRIEEIYRDYALDLFREHPQQFRKAREWMDQYFHQPRLRF